MCYKRQLLDGRVFLGYVVRCVAADVLAAHLEASTLQVQDVDRLNHYKLLFRSAEFAGTNQSLLVARLPHRVIELLRHIPIGVYLSS